MYMHHLIQHGHNFLSSVLIKKKTESQQIAIRTHNVSGDRH